MKKKKQMSEAEKTWNTVTLILFLMIVPAMAGYGMFAYNLGQVFNIHTAIGIGLLTCSITTVVLTIALLYPEDVMKMHKNKFMRS